MINLDEKNNTNTYIEVIDQGKAKTFISSSLVIGDIVIFADRGSNVWAINILSKKVLWKVKLKKPILFEFIIHKNIIYALTINTLFEIDILLGEFKEVLFFAGVSSVTYKGNKIFMYEKGEFGGIIEVDINNFTKKVIKKIKRTITPYNNKQLLHHKDNILFYGNKGLFEYNINNYAIKEIYNNDLLTDVIGGLTYLGENLLLILDTREKVKANENKVINLSDLIPQSNVTSISVLERNGSIYQLDQTEILYTDDLGISFAVSDNYHIAVLGGYIFFQNQESIKIQELPDGLLTSSKCVFYKTKDKIYLFEPYFFHDRSQGEDGFRLYDISTNNYSIKLLEEFKTNILGKNFMRPEFDIFEDKIIVRGDGRRYLIKILDI